MAWHWVQALKPISRHARDGGYHVYQPGDWFECQNQELRALLEKSAVRGTQDLLAVALKDVELGVLCVGGLLTNMDAYSVPTQVASELTLPWEHTLIWRAPFSLTANAAALGLLRLTDGWEIAAMLDDNLLASDCGSDTERAQTLASIGDLRIPAYEVGAVWVRRTPATLALVADWQAQLGRGADARHAFLRALYARGVVMCTLPARWVGAFAWAG